ncbi:MAG: glycerophosphodiester phosphodiesterase family protein [Candidatus Promineifilaceae bacterium]|nr:glycerophosphodiester phosphodiesterase family protein [Candidatus Promineifilaceae bacterium]
MMQKIFLLLLILLAACKMPEEMRPNSASTLEPQMAAETGEFVNNRNWSRLPDGFDVQGHRGARGLKPENTLPAFETALDLGVTTLELDLHFTADQVVVVWHDETIDKEKF